MNRNKIINNIRQGIENLFVKEENQWVDINIININRIDITVVGNFKEGIDKSREQINSLIESANLELNIDEKLKIGFCDLYTLEDADLFGIDKPQERTINNITFGSIIDNDKIKKNKRHKSKIISFYSYKGGVGRTVNLVQTAYLLAANGKKVALIDLDIEAPSFNEIFKNDITNNYGLVEHLYNKIYKINDNDLENKTSVVSMISKLNINTSGDIYVIPAGDINLKYVKRLEKLKEKRIYENGYLEDIVLELEKQYNIDYVLIDSRTGINNWGALSIADISDEVFLCAYPNRENIKGINIILEILNSRQKCTVIFSRFDGSQIGKDEAKRMFNEIKIEQKFIGIEYDPAIALTMQYPIENYANKYKIIADYILEEENIKLNREWIKENKSIVDECIKNLKDDEFYNFITKNEEKIQEKSNFIILKDDDTDLKIIINNIDNNFKIIEMGSNASVDSKEETDKSSINDKDRGTIEPIEDVKILSSIMLSLVDNFINNNLITVDLEAFKKYKEKLNTDSIKEMYSTIKDLTEKFEVEEKIFILLHIDNIICNLREYRVETFDEGDIYARIISIVISMLNGNDKIQYKLIANKKYYISNKNLFEKMGGNILDLSWSELSKENIEILIEELLNNIADKAIGNRDLFHLQGLYKSRTEKIFPKRIDDTRYSEELIEWIANIMYDKNTYGKHIVFNLIKESAKIEDKENKLEKNSIITINSFKQAIGKLFS